MTAGYVMSKGFKIAEAYKSIRNIAQEALQDIKQSIQDLKKDISNYVNSTPSETNSTK